MRIVINADGRLISTDEIRSGYVRSDIYRCPECNEPVVYVRPSNRANDYFRHTSDSRCDGNDQEYEHVYHNKMSEFHRRWQGIFPSSCLEVPIERNRADICLRQDQTQLVIEIQNSKISKETLVQRETSYRSNGFALWWIFNLNNVDHTIEFVKTYCFEEYRLRFKGGDRSFMFLLNLDPSPIVFLDRGEEYIYMVTNRPVFDSEYIKLNPISRANLLAQLSNTFKVDLSWPFPTNRAQIDEYNYESIIPDNLPRENVNSLKECFYLLESLKSSWIFNTNFLFGEAIQKIGSYLALISNKNRNVRNIYIRWCMKNKPTYEQTIKFGKHKGKKIYEIPINYLEWLAEEDIGKDDDFKYEVSMFLYLQSGGLKNRFSRYYKDKRIIGSLINLYRKINGVPTWLPPQISSDTLQVELTYSKRKELAEWYKSH